jgi:hypothetical protein
MQLEELLGFPSQQNSHNTKQVKKLAHILDSSMGRKLNFQTWRGGDINQTNFLPSCWIVHYWVLGIFLVLNSQTILYAKLKGLKW